MRDVSEADSECSLSKSPRAFDCNSFRLTSFFFFVSCLQRNDDFAS